MMKIEAFPRTNDSQMSSTAFEPTSDQSPFVLEKNKKFVYDCSRFIEPHGHDFVLAACKEVHHQKDVAGVKHGIWVDNYVKNLLGLFDDLNAFRIECSVTANAQSMTNEQWLDFARWMAKRIKELSIVENSKSVRTHVRNKLLTILATAKVIPLRIELERIYPRKQAKQGTSKSATKGWNRKEISPKPPSPLVVDGKTHGRDYDYAQYVFLGRQFIIQLVFALANLYPKYSLGRAQTLHESLSNFLRFLLIEQEQGRFPGLFTLLESPDFASIDAIEWERVIYAWRDTQHSTDGRKPQRKLISGHNKVKALTIVWRHLSTEKLVPHVTIVGFKNAKKKSAINSRASLAQLSPESSAQAQVEVELISRLEKFFDKSEKNETVSFLRSLCRALPPEEVRNLNIGELAEKIHSLNSERLQILRAYAESKFIQWWEHWEYGQRLLKTPSHPADELVHLLDSTSLSISERRKNSSRILNNANYDTRLANALTYVIATQNGSAKSLYGRYGHIMKQYGGSAAFHAFLHPHSEATAALWTLLLVDCGANPSVARAIPFDCIKPTNDSKTRKIILGTKNRPKPKVIIDELPINPAHGQLLSVVEGIERYKRMSERYRNMASAEVKKHLLIYEHKDTVLALTDWCARAWFIAMFEQNLELSTLNLRPNCIRPSVLLEIQFRNGNDIAVAQAVGDHVNASTTHQHYTGRTPTKLLHVAKIREFQERFQAVIIVSIDGAASKLGLSEEDFNRIFSEAARTGLGVACLNPQAGIQPGTKPGEDCTRLDACHGCDMRWVVGTENNIADLMLFNEYLVTNQTQAHQKHPEAWEQRWLPWLIFSEIALKKLSQGETAEAYKKARNLLAVRRVDYQPFPLF